MQQSSLSRGLATKGEPPGYMRSAVLFVRTGNGSMSMATSFKRRHSCADSPSSAILPNCTKPPCIYEAPATLQSLTRTLLTVDAWLLAA